MAERIVKVKCPCCGHLTSIPNKTNADRIRAMSDEEMAKYLATVDNDNCPKWKPGFMCYDMNCRDIFEHCWLEWLQEEATE